MISKHVRFPVWTRIRIFRANAVLLCYSRVEVKINTKNFVTLALLVRWMCLSFCSFGLKRLLFVTDEPINRIKELINISQSISHWALNSTPTALSLLFLIVVFGELSGPPTDISICRLFPFSLFWTPTAGCRLHSAAISSSFLLSLPSYTRETI